MIKQARLELTTKVKELQGSIQTLERRINTLETDLESATLNLDMIQKRNNENETLRIEAETQVQGAIDDANMAKRLLAIAKNKYKQTEEAYQLAVEAQLRRVNLRAPMPTIAQTDDRELTRTRTLLDHSREENLALLEELRQIKQEKSRLEQEVSQLRELNPTYVKDPWLEQFDITPPVKPLKEPVEKAAADTPVAIPAVDPQVNPLLQPNFMQEDPIQEAHPEEDIEPAWIMMRGMFGTLSKRIQRQYVHEATIYELGRRLWPNEPPMEEEDLSFPLIKAALEKEWEQWELDNPEEKRASYTVHPTKVKSKELMEGQQEWRKEWLRKNQGTTTIL